MARRFVEAPTRDGTLPAYFGRIARKRGGLVKGTRKRAPLDAGSEPRYRRSFPHQRHDVGAGHYR